jgi:hypothetical protein
MHEHGTDNVRLVIRKTDRVQRQDTRMGGVEHSERDLYARSDIQLVSVLFGSAGEQQLYPVLRVRRQSKISRCFGNSIREELVRIRMAAIFIGRQRN